jgi:hypothetical protein
VKNTFAILAGAVLFAALLTSSQAVEQKIGQTTFKLVAMDPEPETTMGTSDRLYLHLSYESPVPVRFQGEALRQGAVQEEAFTSSTPPYDAGRGEALVWIGFPRPIRIDEIRVTAYDMDWQPLGSLNARTVLTWENAEDDETRTAAAWVEPLLKHHRQVFDTAFDPQPQKPEPLFDVFFLLSFMAIPFYLVMQVQMLLRYRGQWQWYAAAPLLPVVPMGLYTLFGLGLSTSLWIIFLFRYLAVALLYLMILWTVIWFRGRKSREDSSPRLVDDTSGPE